MSTAQALAPSAFAPESPAAPPRRLSQSPSPYLLLVANGNASGLSRRPTLVEDSAQLLRIAGARVETRVTGSLQELDDALATAERRVVLLGGDGSLHAAANSGHPAEFALIPAGGANNVARSLGIPLDPGAAARLAVDGRARPVDAILAKTSTRSYLAVEGVSVGFHALARTGYNGKNSADTMAGIRAGVGALAHFEPFAVCLKLDGESEIVPISQLFVSNTPYFGPSLRVAPNADPSDGVLDVTLIGARSRTSLLALVPHLRRGTHVGREGVRTMQARSIRIASRGRSPVIADTENLGSETVELSVLPHALELVRQG
jgi:diacylglycerol kinase family enzyme